MTADLARLEEIFTAAVAITDPGQRLGYLDRACGADATLREQIEGLLAADADAASFLPLPIDETGSMFAPRCERPGAVIGRYKLLEEIGEGGFGVVFMAEQEEPVRRRVALKIIKAGMDTRQVVARFEAERQALALMDHANIARVYDAGATDTGRPYFVMELVKGIPITTYCDENHLNTDERLALFIAVCSAVQHAHQKGIIHRDLKPSNVLVTLHDDKPVPKIIDFGIAKATQTRLTEKTLFTEFRQLVGTPAYMSPEQTQVIGLDVDTRSDIYSLGVLLYELLTGTTPFDSKELLQSGFDEMRRMIRETEPPKPSTRLSTLPNSGATSARISDARHLSRQLRGDLDWIVMKCLEKDRNRRYETAGDLAADIERHRRNEPVKARPPSAVYRFSKFARRRKDAIAIGAVFVAGFVFLAYSNLTIKRERDATAAALADANAISNTLQVLLASSYPDKVRTSEYTVRQLLDDFSDGLGGQLANQPEVEAAIRPMIGKSYWRLGLSDKAESNLKKAIDLRRQVFGDKDVRVADSLLDYSWIIAEQANYAAAGFHAQQAIGIYESCFPESSAVNAAADALYVLAITQLQCRDINGYRATCRKLIDLPPVTSRGLVERSRPVWPVCLIPNALNDVSRLVKRAEDFAADNSEVGSDRHYVPYVLGAAYFRAGDYMKAVQSLKESIDLYPDQPFTGCDTINYQRLLLAMTKWKLGDQSDARRLLVATVPEIELELRSPATLWVRQTCLELLRKEAEALIGTETGSMPPTLGPRSEPGTSLSTSASEL